MKARKIFAVMLVTCLILTLIASCKKESGNEATAAPTTTASESSTAAAPETGETAAVPDASPTPTPVNQVNVTDAERTVDKNGTIVFGMDGSPNSNYNFYQATTTRLMITTDAIFDKLVYIDPTGTVQPRAAKSWEWAEDGRSITIHLNESYWHDGVPVTADDWVWTIKALCDPIIHDNNISTKLPAYLEGVIADGADAGDEIEPDGAKVEAIDDLTFVIYLNDLYNRTSFELSTLSYLVVLPKHCFQNADGTMMTDLEVLDGTAEYWKKPIGSGPCKFVEDSLDDYTKLEAFDQYYGYGGDGPQFKYLVFQYVSDSTQIGSKIVAGDLDVAYPGVTEDDAMFYENNSAINIIQSATPILQIDINFDCLQAPKYIRLAMNYAIDKQFIVDNFFGGRGAPGGGSLVMPSYKYYLNIGTQQDLELAKSYLDMAIENGSWTADSVFPLNVPNDLYESIANIVKANCESIGLKVDVIRRDSIPTIQQNMFFASNEGYASVLWSFAPTIDPAKVGLYLVKSLTVDSQFFARWGMREEDAADNQAYTDAITLWESAQTPEDEQKYAEDLQKWENEGCPCIAICNVHALYACGNYVASSANAAGVIDVTTVNYYNNDIWNWICYEK